MGRVTRVRRLIAAAVAFAATAVLVTACSSSGSGGGSTGGLGGAPTTFTQALALLSATSWDTTYVAFSDDKQLTTMAGGLTQAETKLPAYFGLGDSAFGELGTAALQTLDLTEVTSSVTIGNPPQQATVLYGSFDAASIGQKLAAAGYRQQPGPAGTTLWEFGNGSPAVGADNPFSTGELDVIGVSGSRLIYGVAADPVNAIAAPPTAPLSSVTALSAVASCLGSAKSGLIGQEAYGQSNSPLLGIGLTADSVADANEELCVTAPSSADVAGIESNWSNQITTGTSARLNEPWSKLMTDPQATTTSTTPPVVRLTAQRVAGARIGVLITNYLAATSDISKLITP